MNNLKQLRSEISAGFVRKSKNVYWNVNIFVHCQQQICGLQWLSGY